MSSHFLVDKGMRLEARFGGFEAAGRAFPEPGVAPRYAPDRGFELRHVALDLEIDPDRPGLSGRAALTVAPLPSGLGEVVFDLDDATVSAVTDHDGCPLRWRHADGRLAVQGLGQDGGVVRVAWTGQPTRGLYFTGPDMAAPDRARSAWTQCQDEDGHHVFPCVDHPSVKCPFTVRVTAPDRYQVVSNGVLVDRSPSGDRTTWTWQQERPIPAYLVTVVVGAFLVVEERLGDLPVRYLVPEGADEATVRRVFGRTPRMIAHFAQTFGVPYPWPRYDQVVVHDFIFGGMENAGATTLTDLVLTDDRAALDWNADDLVAHELAHQWFGDLVTCQDWSQGWLNEGWATYSEYVWRHHDLGEDEASYELFGQLGAYLGEDAERYRRSIVHYRFRNPIDVFDRHLYEKGALVLHTLRTVLGDGAFWTGARRYLERHGDGTVHTRDLQRAMEEVSGRNLDGFFHQFVHGAGHPELEVELSHGDGLLTVTVTQKQEGEGVAEVINLPLHLGIVHGDEVRLVVLPVRERSRTWTLACPEPPDRVEVDTRFTVLADLAVKGPRSLLLASLARDRGVVGRIRAARALAREGSAASIDALARALAQDPHWGVRAEIAPLLARHGGERAREALLAALADEHPKARRATVAALGQLRDPDVEAALARLVRAGDPSVQVESAAAAALGQLRADGAVDLLASVTERASWGEKIRSGALEGIAATQQASALPVLLAWTAPERPQRARAAAAAGLGRLANEVEDTRREAVDRLLELARDAPFRVRLAAIGALGVARDPRAAATLHHLHTAVGDGRLARTAFEAARRVAAGRSSDQALAGLNRALEELRDDNRKLRDRVTRLEDCAGG